jgi:hypothetical protein
MTYAILRSLYEQAVLAAHTGRHAEAAALFRGVYECNARSLEAVEHPLSPDRAMPRAAGRKQRRVGI